jgi:emfourin
MRISFVALAAFAAACSNSGTTSGPSALNDFGSFNQAAVQITAEGGIAALSQTHRVSHDDRGFVYVMRHLCAQNCGAPLDSASGALTANVSDSLFNIVLEQARQLSKDDYGINGQAADAMVYTLTITANGVVKTVRADDTTMPQPMRQIVSSVQGVIQAARK